MELKCNDKNLCYSLSFYFCLILVISFLSGCSDKPKADPELDYPPLYQQIGYSDAQIRYWRETKTNSVMSSDENDSLLVYTHSNQPDVRYLYVFNNHICTTIGISIKTDDQRYFLNKINSFYKEWGFKRLHNEVGSLFGKDNYVSYIEIDQVSLTEKNYILIIFEINKQVENKNSNYLEYDNFYKLLGETRESIESTFGKCTRTSTIDGQRVEIHDITKTTFFVFNYRNDKVLRSSVILESTDIKSMKKIIEFIAKKVSNDGYKEIDFSNGVSTVSNGKINIQFKSEPNGDQFRLIFNSFFTDPTVLGTGWSQSNFGDDYTNKLYLSIEDDDVYVVKKYIDDGWDLETKKGELKQTIFSYACAVGSIEVVKYLISKGADVNSRNSDIAITPLMYALPSSTSSSEYYAKKLKVFLYLLQQPKVDIFYKNSSSKNILDIAMIMEPNNHEIIEAIRKEFESRGKQEINNNLTTERNNLRVNEGNPNPSMVYVEGGHFLIGSKDESYNNPMVDEVIESFLIDKYEVTQKEFEKVMGYNPSVNKCSDCPVENLTFREAVRYAKKVGKRLPTEIEWEYAARGGIKSKGYIYSGSNEMYEVGWGKQMRYVPSSVGKRESNELGIYDMTGNVREWCGYFEEGPGYARGGSYLINMTVFHRTSYDRQERWSKDIGFRCVKDLEK